MAETIPALPSNDLQVWAGIECTINRVGDAYFDQLQYSGHYDRCESDIEALASLGIEKLRYPILWERHQPVKQGTIDWTFAANALHRLGNKGIAPIAGLVHHGSGPDWVSFYDGSFEKGLRDYALQVATRFPWIEYYTPVNEPLTTARFCGLYGHWYPHACSADDFARILVSECRGIIMAMEAIRSVNPDAKLIQTEDLGKTYSTPLLSYQARHENSRRWLAFDLLCGRVTDDHPLRKFLTDAGITDEELRFFQEHPTPPSIIGLNYYVTSERYIDEDIDHYPAHTLGDNGLHQYADVEAVRVQLDEETGLKPLLREAWSRYGLPLAITEAHLHCSREHQLRWLRHVWQTASGMRREEGLDIRAVTAWAAFGSFGWDQLLRHPHGTYEPGIFDIRSGKARPTAIAEMLRSLCLQKCFDHPVMTGSGWWEQDSRVLYRARAERAQFRNMSPAGHRPLVILGKTGTLGKAFSRICAERGIPHVLLGRQDLDICHGRHIREVLLALNPWAVVNATGYVRVEDAEIDQQLCFQVNSNGAIALARACAEAGIRLLSFSSDLVFDGLKGSAYTEEDAVSPLNTYGRSKAAAEEGILHDHPASMIVRTSAFFGPWDPYNFVHAVRSELEAGRTFAAASDVVVTPTYVPDLVHECLDLLQDGAAGIWHISHKEAVSWAGFAQMVAGHAGLDTYMILPLTQAEMGWKARQPSNSALCSVRGVSLPSLYQALDRYFRAVGLPASVIA